MITTSRAAQRALKAALVLALAAPVAVAGIVVSADSAAANTGCTLVARQPFRSGGVVRGYGGRNGCGVARHTEVRLRRHRPLWVDDTMDSVTFTVTNGERQVRHQSPAGGESFHTDTISDGSPRIRSTSLVW